MARDEKAPIELLAPVAKQAAGPTASGRFDEAVLRLACLIGRQIAREEFERHHGNGKRGKRAAEIKKLGKSP